MWLRTTRREFDSCRGHFGTLAQLGERFGDIEEVAGSSPAWPTMRVTAKDCERQTFRGSGPGGQHRNKTDTGVRFIHHPSGARAESCETRSQHENARLAWRKLGESQEFRRWALGGPQEPVEPSTERIRTYNLIERRVTDHRTGHKSSDVDGILDGDIDQLYQ